MMRILLVAAAVGVAGFCTWPFAVYYVGYLIATLPWGAILAIAGVASLAGAVLGILAFALAIGASRVGPLR